MNSLRTKVINLVSLIVFALVVMLPPIIHGYIYPSVGDDSGLHLEIIKNGNLFNQLYYAYVLVGYPIRWISSISGIDINTLFLWFNYIVLVGVGLTFYFVLTRLVNYKAGLLGLVVPIFISLGIWWQFDYGMIFNIINMGIILPLLIYSFIQWIIKRKTYRLVMVFILTILYSGFHSTGIYFTSVMGILMLGYIIFNHKKLDRTIIFVMSTTIIIALALSYYLYAKTQALLPDAITQSFQGELFPIQFYINGISYVTMMMVFCSIYIIYKKQIALKTKLLLYCLVVFSVMLLIISLGLSPSPDRQVFDMCTMIALIACVLIGIAIEYNKDFTIIVGLLVVVGLILNTNGYWGYRNAVKQVDKETISYVNTLNLANFTVGENVAPLIYKQFINSEYIDGDADILIVRSEPMTPVSDRDSISYVTHWITTDDYNLLKGFSNDNIEINIFKRIVK